MNWVHPTSLLLTTWGVAFLQTSPWIARTGFGVQPDFLPALVVYAAFNASLATTVGVATCAALSYDALSSGPFGASLLPMLLTGVAMHRRRDLVLKDSVWSQLMLGWTGTVCVTVLALMFLWVFGPLVDAGAPFPGHWPDGRPEGGAGPEFGVRWLWQGTLVAVLGAMATPIVFGFFGWIDAAFDYRPVDLPMNRGSREIERGRG